MKVYIVCRPEGAYGENVERVFATEELAKKYLENLIKENQWLYEDWYYLEEEVITSFNQTL